MIECPFTILIDTAEDRPFTFLGIHADANQKRRVFSVPTKRANLGRHPHSLGDYTIDGAWGEVAIERKSMEDAWGTLLGWPTGWERDRDLPGRRKRFEHELWNLNNVRFSLVVVEASLGACCANMPSWGKKPEEENAKIFFRTVISYQQRFPRVQWAFCDSTRLAEIFAFRWLYRFWRKQVHGMDRSRKRGRTCPSGRPLDGDTDSSRFWL
jgi:hypothetical protein